MITRMLVCLVAFMGAVPVFSPVFAADGRGTKAERLKEVVKEADRLLELKKTLAENEAYAKAHPEEAKRCFDPMMEVADKHGIVRHVYFSDNQAYYRQCIEQQVNARNE